MEDTYNLLWTSGWDSTFRLLQIILIEKKNVQPLYIIDKGRKSFKKELETIDKIKQHIEKNHFEAYQLILPIRFIEKEKIIINKEIADSTSLIRSYIRIGSQYSWLAQFCSDNRLKKVEIGIDKNTNKQSFTNFLTRNYIISSYSDSKNKELYNSIHCVFQYFSFPIFNLSKLEMLEIAKKNNWLDIMYLTWFCHKPKKDKPCGKCVPCIAVIKKGLGFRIPKTNRIKGKIKLFFKSFFFKILINLF